MVKLKKEFIRDFRTCLLESCACRANTGQALAEEVLPSLQALGALTSDIMVVNFAVWSNR